MSAITTTFGGEKLQITPSPAADAFAHYDRAVRTGAAPHRAATDFLIQSVVSTAKSPKFVDTMGHRYEMLEADEKACAALVAACNPNPPEPKAAPKKPKGSSDEG